MRWIVQCLRLALSHGTVLWIGMKISDELPHVYLSGASNTFNDRLTEARINWGIPFRKILPFKSFFENRLNNFLARRQARNHG